MKKLLSRTAIGAMVCLIATLVIAGPPMGRPGPPFGQNPAQMAGHMADRLDMSDDQRIQVKALLEAEHKRLQTERGKLAELRSQLMSMYDEFDSEKAKEITDQMGIISGKLAYSRAHSLSEISEILTEEQRAQLGSFLKDRPCGWGDRHKR